MRVIAAICALILATAVSASPLNRRDEQQCGNQWYDPSTGTCFYGKYICGPGAQCCVDDSTTPESYSCYDPTLYTCNDGKLASRPPAETCGDQQYIPDQGVCYDNQYICELGENVCIDGDDHSCYPPNQYQCVNGKLVQRPPAKLCGDQYYIPDTGTCFDNQYVCPIPDEACPSTDGSTFVCYLTSSYNCTNGTLVDA